MTEYSELQQKSDPHPAVDQLLETIQTIPDAAITRDQVYRDVGSMLLRPTCVYCQCVATVDKCRLCIRDNKKLCVKILAATDHPVMQQYPGQQNRPVPQIPKIVSLIYFVCNLAISREIAGMSPL